MYTRSTIGSGRFASSLSSEQHAHQQGLSPNYLHRLVGYKKGCLAHDAFFFCTLLKDDEAVSLSPLHPYTHPCTLTPFTPLQPLHTCTLAITHALSHVLRPIATAPAHDFFSSKCRACEVFRDAAFVHLKQEQQLLLFEISVETSTTVVENSSFLLDI